MIREMAIDTFVSLGTMKDICRARNFVKDREIRLIRIPIVEWAKAIDKAVKLSPYIPFSPTILGIPCDGTEHALPEILVVRDDNTNGVKNVITEMEA